MATTSHGLTADGLIALSDVHLFEEFDRWIGRVQDVDDTASDALSFLLDELSERFAPALVPKLLERRYLNDSPDLDDDLLNYSAARAAVERRKAARMIRDALDEGGEAS